MALVEIFRDDFDNATVDLSTQATGNHGPATTFSEAGSELTIDGRQTLQDNFFNEDVGYAYDRFDSHLAGAASTWKLVLVEAQLNSMSQPTFPQLAMSGILVQDELADPLNYRRNGYWLVTRLSDWLSRVYRAQPLSFYGSFNVRWSRTIADLTNPHVYRCWLNFDANDAFSIPAGAETRVLPPRCVGMEYSTDGGTTWAWAWAESFDLYLQNGTTQVSCGEPTRFGITALGNSTWTNTSKFDYLTLSQDTSPTVVSEERRGISWYFNYGLASITRPQITKVDVTAMLPSAAFPNELGGMTFTRDDNEPSLPGPANFWFPLSVDATAPDNLWYAYDQGVVGPADRVYVEQWNGTTWITHQIREVGGDPMNPVGPIPNGYSSACDVAAIAAFADGTVVLGVQRHLSATWFALQYDGANWSYHDLHTQDPITYPTDPTPFTGYVRGFLKSTRILQFGTVGASSQCRFLGNGWELTLAPTLNWVAGAASADGTVFLVQQTGNPAQWPVYRGAADAGTPWVLEATILPTDEPGLFRTQSAWADADGDWILFNDGSLWYKPPSGSWSQIDAAAVPAIGQATNLQRDPDQDYSWAIQEPNAISMGLRANGTWNWINPQPQVGDLTSGTPLFSYFVPPTGIEISNIIPAPGSGGVVGPGGQPVAPTPGGTLIQATLANVAAGQQIAIHLGPNGDTTDPQCFGTEGFGYQPFVEADLTVQFVTPPLAKGLVDMTVVAAEGTATATDAVLIVERNWPGKLHATRKLFPPWQGVGKRRLELEDLE